jgi:Uma2 family endonuclease
MATIESLLTAEEYFLQPENGQPTELVRGRIVMMNRPGFDHGVICSNIDHLLRTYLDEHKLGRVVVNDAGVVTEREPDSVRGPDVAYYSFERLPKAGRRPRGYPRAVPELVFEVRLPSDRQSAVLEKVPEYLTTGVSVVCTVEPEDETVTLYFPDRAQVTLTNVQELAGLDFLPGFTLPLAQIFE